MNAGASGLAAKGLPACKGIPALIEKSKIILETLRKMSLEECKELWDCNQKLAELNYQRLDEINLYGLKDGVPALFAYEGIQYRYMASKMMEGGDYDYLQENLRILSGFYGCLRPLDGIFPYRLEMESPLCVQGMQNLYDFWSRSIYQQVMDESRVVVNLASKEYSKVVSQYLQPEDRFVTVVFGELVANKMGKNAGERSEQKIVQKGTFAKMARGEMVHYLVQKKASKPEDMQGFKGQGFAFCEERSTESEYVFLK